MSSLDNTTSGGLAGFEGADLLPNLDPKVLTIRHGVCCLGLQHIRQGLDLDDSRLLPHGPAARGATSPWGL